MEKLKIWFIIFMTSTVGLAVSLFVIALTTLPSQDPIGLILRIVLEGFPTDIPFFIPLATLLYLSTVLASVVGVTYFLVLPEIRTYHSAEGQWGAGSAAEMVLKTLKPDERRVMEVLMAHQGRYLQKYISKEAGLSKLKTHRIVARFSERGIVTVVRKGNTNEVTLAPWLHPHPSRGPKEPPEGPTGATT
jgi:hypothetical protein